MKILEARIEFENDGRIKKIAVLVDFSSTTVKPLTDVRAIVATTKPMWGYTVLSPDEPISGELLKRVAGKGNTENDTVEFPGWKKRYRK